MKSSSLSLPADPWSIQEASYAPEAATLAETLFSLANGYIGMRGTFEEGSGGNPSTCEGTYLNGVFVRERYHYPESAYAFATHNNKMIQAPEGKCIRLTVDGETFLTGVSVTENHFRSLDFREGVLLRALTWQTASGKRLSIRSRRLISLAEKHLAAIEYTITAENFSGGAEIASFLDATGGAQGARNPDDPRAGDLSALDSLQIVEAAAKGGGGRFLHRIKGRDVLLCSAITHILPPNATLRETLESGDRAGAAFDLALEQGKPATLIKFIACHHGSAGDEDALKAAAEATLARAVENGFDHYAAAQKNALGEFWRNADVEIEGDPALQQGLRFNMFHLFQSVSRDGTGNIAAKGLSGPGYDGHYFWDTEIYVIPFFVYSNPSVARKLLEYRHRILNAARERARQMAHPKGALFAWRTIGGEECSAYYPAGTAQYHINAAVAYATRQYFDATQDWEFMERHGAEMLFETARIWPGLGHFNPRRQGKFCIYAVTGPDEYSAVVNNNFYTNVMARMHLRFAAEIAETLRGRAPEAYRALAEKIRLEEGEIAEWKRIAGNMYLPWDEALGIHVQDDAFLDRPRWDFAGTPKEKYPLLLHFHPLVIYRHQVLKQADTVLATVLLGDEFTPEEKRRDLEFYEPLTTHDSTLSSCIYSIASSEAGKHAEAYAFFGDSARMDLDNHHGNTEYGLHMACMAGSWMSVILGFAGMRAWGGTLRFAPVLPSRWRAYAFKALYRGSRIRISVTEKEAVYALLEGPEITIRHGEQALALKPGKPQAVSLLARNAAA